MRNLVSLASGALVALLGLPALGQLQVDWRQTYSAVTPPVLNSEHVDSVAVAPNGDLIWTSVHYVAANNPFPNWVEHAELHRSSASGAPIWTLSSPATSNSHFQRVDIDAAGDLYFSGFAGLNWGSFTEPLVVKVSASGTFLWSRTVSGTAYADDIGFGSLDPSGNFTFIGVHNDFSTPTHFVRTYDTNGNVILDTLAFSTPLGLDGLWNAQPFPGGGFCVTGSSVTGMFVARLAFDGTLLWRRPLPQGPASTGLVHGLAVDSSGRVAAAGAELDAASNARTVMVLHDSNGNRLLDYTGSSQGSHVAPQCHFAPDGSLWLVSEEATLPSGTPDLVLRRWRRDLTLAAAATHPSQTSVTVVGEAGQLWILSNWNTLQEFAPTGALNWSQPLASPGSFDDYWSLVLGADRHFLVVGRHDNSAGALTDTDALLLRLDATDIPRGYCEGMQGTLGCAPLLQFEGSPRVGAASGFVVSATPWPSQMTGSFLAGIGPAIATPFFGGTLCVGAPRVRTVALLSGGNPVGAPDCSGALTLDYGAWASGALGGSSLPGLQSAGTSVRLQAWSRDPGSATNTLLSDALEFTVLP